MLSELNQQRGAFNKLYEVEDILLMLTMKVIGIGGVKMLERHILF